MNTRHAVFGHLHRHPGAASVHEIHGVHPNLLRSPPICSGTPQQKTGTRRALGICEVSKRAHGSLLPATSALKLSNCRCSIRHVTELENILWRERARSGNGVPNPRNGLATSWRGFSISCRKRLSPWKQLFKARNKLFLSWNDFFAIRNGVMKRSKGEWRGRFA
jgi:hypothetical protein